MKTKYSLIIALFSLSFCGYSQDFEWDSSYSYVNEDSILEEGEMDLRVHSLPCFECYHVKNDSLIPYETSYCRVQRIGVWTITDLKTAETQKGEYSNFVHEDNATYLITDTTAVRGPLPNGIGTHYLKEGKWLVYDKEGNLISERWYSKDFLIQEGVILK